MININFPCKKKTCKFIATIITVIICYIVWFSIISHIPQLKHANSEHVIDTEPSVILENIDNVNIRVQMANVTHVNIIVDGMPCLIFSSSNKFAVTCDWDKSRHH